MAVAAAPVASAPQRVASLDLCADELVLRLATPGQLVSVSRLGADPAETTLSDRARGLTRNNGRLSDVAPLAPDLVVTSGGIGGGLAATLATRLHITVLALSPARDLDSVRANVRRVADALGRQAVGEAEIARFDAALGPLPAQTRSALLIGSNGMTSSATGLAATFLRYAGLKQQRNRGAVRLEMILSEPPQVLVHSRYHAGQTSLGALWLQHPAWRRLPASTRQLSTDGRPWTCQGLELAPEIARLRGQLKSVSIQSTRIIASPRRRPGPIKLKRSSLMSPGLRRGDNLILSALSSTAGRSPITLAATFDLFGSMR